MLKALSITAALVFTSMSAVAIAEPAASASFVHDGQTYTYSVEQKANTRVIRGTAEKSGKPFVLYVSAKKVTGTVDGRYVSFSRSDVKTLADDIQVASR